MVALDNMGLHEVYSFMEKLPADFPWVKIGLEQYLAHGKDLIKTVHEKYEKRIFLDLKLHDIPNTVAKALGSLSGLPVEFITVHLSGGRGMLEAVQKVRSEKMSHVNILGVSYLTSLDQNDLKETFGYQPDQIANAFKRLFTLALETKTQGVVCSPHELGEIRALEEKYQPLTKVCPGIRFQDEIAQGALGDQKRVMNPQEAFHAGANFLVMGRSLTKANDLGQRLLDLNRN